MRVLVANRGEIACRVLRCLRAFGASSVAVFTPPDAASPHVWLADSAHALAEPDDYLNGAKLIAVARRAGATAVHPGYGFLSQSPAFAQAVADAGLTFIGPSPAAMAALGDKRAARSLAQACGIPVVPGAQGLLHGEEAAKLAASLGYPLLIKAAGGGGGRGMRRVSAAAELDAAVQAAGREAQAAFGDGRLLLERYVHPARHIEVQILGDGRHTLAVGDRECSLQRRYQKVLEEGPAASLPEGARAQLCDYAVRLGERVGYSGAGTVEFLLGPGGDLYFLEVNTRLQVEHPVTEMTSGVDLVAAQLRLAHGGDVAHEAGLPPRGHAIEVRLNAEDASQQFVPQTGDITAVSWPAGPHLRVDAGVDVGTAVSPHYDPLLAKIIAWGPSRATALATLTAAVDELLLLGVQHNQGFLAALLRHPDVIAGDTFTTTVEEQTWPAPPTPAYAAAVAQAPAPRIPGQAGAELAGPWTPRDNFRGLL